MLSVSENFEPYPLGHIMAPSAPNLSRNAVEALFLGEFLIGVLPPDLPYQVGLIPNVAHGAPGPVDLLATFVDQLYMVFLQLWRSSSFMPRPSPSAGYLPEFYLLIKKPNSLERKIPLLDLQWPSIFPHCWNCLTVPAPSLHLSVVPGLAE